MYIYIYIYIYTYIEVWGGYGDLLKANAAQEQNPRTDRALLFASVQ